MNEKEPLNLLIGDVLQTTADKKIAQIDADRKDHLNQPGRNLSFEDQQAVKAIIQEQRPALDNVVLTLAFGIPTLTLADICQMSD